MSDYRRLKVWEKAHELAIGTYRITEGYPRTEWYGLMSQMRRAAVSIPSNIAEGYGNGYNKNITRFLNVAMGSAFELEYQFLLSRDLGYIEKDMYEEMNQSLVEVKKMLSGLIKSLRR